MSDPKITGNKWAGPPPINKTIKKYFQSLNWREFWDRVKNDNPIVFIVIKKQSGIIESVMLKEAKKGEEFNVDPQELIERQKLLARPIPVPPPPPSDEEVMREIGVLMDTQEIPPQEPRPIPEVKVKEKKEFKPPVHPEGESTDLEIGDSIIVSHNLEKKKCYVVSINDEQQEVTVEFPDGSMVTKQADEIISLAK